MDLAKVHLTVFHWRFWTLFFFPYMLSSSISTFIGKLWWWFESPCPKSWLSKWTKMRGPAAPPTPPCRTTTRGETSCEAFEFVFLVVPREVKWKFGYDAKRDSGPAHPWWREWYDEHNFTKEAYWNYFQYHCEAAVSLVPMKLSPLKLDSPFVSR